MIANLCASIDMLLIALLLQATTCTATGNVTRCVPDPVILPPPPVRYDAPQIDGQAMRNLGVAMRARKARGRAKKVGQMLANGQCQEAVQFALEKGELGLADYARSYCASR